MGAKANLGSAWQKPGYRWMAIATAVLGGAGLLVGFTTVNKAASPSAVMTPPDMQSLPGEAVTPAQRAALQETNDQRAAEARAKGGSAIATPLIPEAAAAEDPLAPYRQHSAHSPEPAPAPQSPAPAQQPHRESELERQMADRLRQAMLQRVGEIKQDRALVPAKVSVVQAAPAQQQTATSAGAATGSTQKPASPPVKAVIRAGTVEYAKLVFESNSDIQGPLVAEVLSGPCVGAVAMGQVTNSQEHQVFNFTTMNCNGVDYTIQAVAVDPETGSFGLADDVDHHYLERIALPVAAAFVRGYGEAASEARTTVVMNGGVATTATDPLSARDKLFKAGGRAAETVSSLFEQQASSLKNTVRNYASKPIGLLFLRSVVEEGQK